QRPHPAASSLVPGRRWSGMDLASGDLYSTENRQVAGHAHKHLRLGILLRGRRRLRYTAVEQYVCALRRGSPVGWFDHTRTSTSRHVWVWPPPLSLSRLRNGKLLHRRPSLPLDALAAPRSRPG